MPNKVLAVIIALLALVYGIYPADVIPENQDAIPLLGWLDDLNVLIIAGMNVYQQFACDQNFVVVKIAKYAKWVMATLFIIASELLWGANPSFGGIVVGLVIIAGSVAVGLLTVIVSLVMFVLRDENCKL
ncbi:MAG: DUF1232 domain-containing protein [Fibrobacter sp.]|nr:DUF1232 domain-containing protein [Fibrobacter sp.]MCQ2091129.1 DUF1232 domain-containing protein [Fibrobacter sp.]